MKKVTLSSVSHSASLRGCTLVVNLNPALSFIKTTPAGTEALRGEIILHMPGIEKQNQIIRSQFYQFTHSSPKYLVNIHNEKLEELKYRKSQNKDVCLS